LKFFFKLFIHQSKLKLLNKIFILLFIIIFISSIPFSFSETEITNQDILDKLSQMEEKSKIQSQHTSF